MGKQRGEDGVFVGFASNLPRAVARSRDDAQLGPPPVDSDLIAQALAAAEPKPEQTESNSAEDVEPEPASRSWVKWLLIALVVVALGYVGYQRYSAKTEVTQVEDANTAETTQVPADNNEAEPVGDAPEEKEEEAP